MNSEEVSALKAQAGGVAEVKAAVESARDKAPATVDFTPDSVSESPTVTAAEATETPPAPTLPAADSISVDGDTLTADHIRQMRTELQGLAKKETEITQRERTLGETRRQVEALVTDALSTSKASTGESQIAQEAYPATPAATVVDPTPLTDALEPIASRLTAMEQVTEIQGLRERFGDIDEQAVREAMDSAPGLSAESALAFLVGAQVLKNQSSAASEEAVQRTSEAARTETSANAGVVPTETLDPSTTSWAGLESVARRDGASKGPLLVTNTR